MGVVRSTYIIGEQGVIEKVMPKVKPDIVIKMYCALPSAKSFLPTRSRVVITPNTPNGRSAIPLNTFRGKRGTILMP